MSEQDKSILPTLPTLPNCNMTGINNNFNFSFWNTEKTDILSMLMIMIESSSQSIERHENFIPEVRYRLLVEDTLSVLEICKNLLEKEDSGENEKEKISKSMDKIINEYINLQEYLRKNNKDQLDRIEEKLDKSLQKKRNFFNKN